MPGRQTSRCRRAGPRALFFLGLCAVVLGASPARSADHDGQVWVPITARIKLADRVKLFLESQSRMGGNGMRQQLIRLASGYDVKPYWGLYLGYGWTPSFNEFRNEERIFQESLFDNHLGSLRLINRTRLEERFIDDVEGVSIRFRHMTRLLYPLDHGHHWFLAASDEPFVTFNDATGGPGAGFDQNRAYVGVRLQFTSRVGVEVGYMNQYINKPVEDLLSNNAVVSLDFSM